MNDEIFPAREVTKTDTLRVNTFDTREFGHLGTVDEKEIRIQRKPQRTTCDQPAPFDLRKLGADLPRAEIVPGYVEAGGESVEAFTKVGVRGIVFAGTPSPAQGKAAIEAAEQGSVLVAANGYGAGAVHVDPTMPVIGARDLNAKKARILLQLAMASSDDPEQIATWFETL